MRRRRTCCCGRVEFLRTALRTLLLRTRLHRHRCRCSSCRLWGAYVVLLAAGLHVVVAAAIITPQDEESVAAGSTGLVLQSLFGLKRHVNPCQRLVATDSMSEMTVLTSSSMSVTTPPGSVNSSSMTETTSSPSETIFSRISGASVGSDLTKEVSSKPSWISSGKVQGEVFEGPRDVTV